MSVTKMYFGKTSDGREVNSFKITSSDGIEAEVLDYGVTIRTLIVHDKNQNPVDVVLGYDTIEEYENNDGYFGATVGRFANRICGGKFTLNGKEYTLALNNGANHLHGGVVGFSKYVWDAEEIEDGVLFSMTSPDGDEGYPGTLNLKVAVTLKNGAINLNYHAVSDKDTIVNFTNHSYFNLNGGAGDIHGHLLTLNADYFMMNDKGGLPTGEVPPVKGTAMDFTTEHAIGDAIDSDDDAVVASDGYDNNYVIRENPAAIVRSEKNGIVMTVITDQPGVQLYTANKTSARKGKNGAEYGRRSALCLETQHYPDCINHPEWPSCILKAGEEFNSTTTYSFSINKD